MTSASLFNSALGFGAILTLAFSIPDVKTMVIDAPKGSHPLLWIFLKTTTYFGLTTVMGVVLLLLIIGASISVLATASRHVVAFARDSGLPFASIWMHVAVARVPGTEAPVNAFLLSLTTTIVLALANLGVQDTLAFSLSVAVVAMATGYVLLFISVLYRRLHGNVDGTHSEVGTGEGLPRASWSLGFWAAPINVIATGYVLFVFAMAFFPVGASDLRLGSMNWTALVWIVVVVFASCLYALHGRYVYRLPIRSRSSNEQLEVPPEMVEQPVAAPSPNI
jgi:choline transport protein